MTKPITAVALMTLYDEGQFELDHKLSRYIPEFAEVMVYNPDKEMLEPQKEELTIRHLLTHSSGIVYGWGQSHVDSLYREGLGYGLSGQVDLESGEYSYAHVFNDLVKRSLIRVDKWHYSTVG